MHPRERVIGLAMLIKKKGGTYPEKLIQEALRLGITLPELNPRNESKNEKEKPNGTN